MARASAARSPGAGLRALRVVTASAAGRIGLLVLGGAALVAVAGPYVAPATVGEPVGPVLGAPTRGHPFGFDDVGADVLWQLVVGARTTLLVGVTGALVATVVGAAVGLVAGYFGGWLDEALMRATDYMLVIPLLPLMIVVAAVRGPSLSSVVIAIGGLLWMRTARVVRAEVSSIRERVFVQRARSIGARELRVLRAHVAPHVLPIVVGAGVITLSEAIFLESALAFLNLGDPNSPSWGLMISNAFERAAMSAGAWWAIAPPGLAIALVVLAGNLLGLSIEERLDPRLRTAHLSPRTFTVVRPTRGGRS